MADDKQPAPVPSGPWDGVGAPGAPIMGGRKDKLLTLARETFKTAKKNRDLVCTKLCLSQDGKRVTKPFRHHTMLCVRLTKQLDALERLFRGI